MARRSRTRAAVTSSVSAGNWLTVSWLPLDQVHHQPAVDRAFGKTLVEQRHAARGLIERQTVIHRRLALLAAREQAFEHGDDSDQEEHRRRRRRQGLAKARAPDRLPDIVAQRLREFVAPTRVEIDGVGQVGIAQQATRRAPCVAPAVELLLRQRARLEIAPVRRQLIGSAAPTRDESLVGQAHRRRLVAALGDEKPRRDHGVDEFGARASRAESLRAARSGRRRSRRRRSTPSPARAARAGALLAPTAKARPSAPPPAWRWRRGVRRARHSSRRSEGPLPAVARRDRVRRG